MLNFVPGEQVWTRSSENDMWWPAKVLESKDIPEEVFGQLFSNGMSFDSSAMYIVSFYGDESLGVALKHTTLVKPFDETSAEDEKMQVQDSSRLEAIVSALIDRENCVVTIHRDDVSSAVDEGLAVPDARKRSREDDDDQQYTDNILQRNKKEKRSKREKERKREDRHRHRIKEERPRGHHLTSLSQIGDTSAVRQPSHSRKSSLSVSQIITIKEDLVASLDSSDIHRARTALLRLSHAGVNYPILKETLVGRDVARAMEEMAPIRGLAKAILGDWMRQLPIETRMAIEKESEILRNKRDNSAGVPQVS
eukprot:Tbor_TRINITY_DN4982_c0_g2::TRINITY_DN4982_c0_g2_i1::g.9740::m.9740